LHLPYLNTIEEGVIAQRVPNIVDKYFHFVFLSCQMQQCESPPKKLLVVHQRLILDYLVVIDIDMLSWQKYK
jgi:hypothetical protein